jgi:hypothetical protein
MKPSEYERSRHLIGYIILVCISSFAAGKIWERFDKIDSQLHSNLRVEGEYFNHLVGADHNGGRLDDIANAPIQAAPPIAG